MKYYFFRFWQINSRSVYCSLITSLSEITAPCPRERNFKHFSSSRSAREYFETSRATIYKSLRSTVYDLVREKKIRFPLFTSRYNFRNYPSNSSNQKAAKTINKTDSGYSKMNLILALWVWSHRDLISRLAAWTEGTELQPPISIIQKTTWLNDLQMLLIFHIKNFHQSRKRNFQTSSPRFFGRESRHSIFRSENGSRKRVRAMPRVFQ